MKLKRLKNSNNAVVGIVAAFLIVGLIVTVISVVQTQYVPKWMKEKESEHMDKVAEQFNQLKYSIDIHSVAKQKGNAITNSFVLGSKEMPYLMSVRAFGQLRILNNNFNIKIRNDSKNYSFTTGLIKYESFNSYYINQNYIFEGGAVILTQDQGEAIRIKPVFTADLEADLVISYDLSNISTVGNKDRSAVGYGPVQIQTEFSSAESYDLITNVSNISINTTYLDAWHSFLNSTFIKAGLNYAGYGTDYTIEIINDLVYVEFTGSIVVNMDIDIINIYAQIGPGFIEE